MRLIDADALKEAIFSKSDSMEDLWDTAGVLNLINNNPTVDLDESIIQEVLNKRCMTAVANEYLVALHGKRPQGDFTRKELVSWLWTIAINNTENELGRSCKEIIHRLDGFERYVSDIREEAAGGYIGYERFLL